MLESSTLKSWTASKMAIRVQVQVSIGDARARLERARELGLHPRPLLEIAGAILEESTRERFRTSRGPGGVPWPMSRRNIHGGRPDARGAGSIGPSQGGRPLIDKGGLLSSVAHRANDDEVRVGIIAKTKSAKFGYVQQFGATIVPRKAAFLVFRGADGHLVFAKSVTIPARPFLGVDANDRADLIEAWDAHLEAELGE